jgi:hypothetical protein
MLAAVGIKGRYPRSSFTVVGQGLSLIAATLLGMGETPAPDTKWPRNEMKAHHQTIHLPLEGICGVPEDDICRGTPGQPSPPLLLRDAESRWLWTSDWGLVIVDQWLAANPCPLTPLLSAWRPFQKIQNCSLKWRRESTPIIGAETAPAKRPRELPPQHGMGWPAASLSFGPEEAAAEWNGVTGSGVQCCGTVTIYYGSGSDFWKVMVPVPVPTFEKVTVPVPVPAPYLDYKKQIFKKKFGIFFYFLLSKLFYKEKVHEFQQIYGKMWMKKMFNEGNQIHNL